MAPTNVQLCLYIRDVIRLMQPYLPHAAIETKGPNSSRHLPGCVAYVRTWQDDAGRLAVMTISEINFEVKK